MNLEEYKKKVLEALEKQVEESWALKLMEAYEVDFPQFLKDNWSPESAAFAMIMGY